MAGRSQGEQAQSPPVPSAPTKGRLQSFLELFALTGLVVAQPVLRSFGDSPETFVGYDADRLDVVLFALFVTVAPAALLWAVVQLVGVAGARVRRWAHLAVVFVLFTALGIQAGKDLSDLGYKRLPLLAAVLAVLLTWLVGRSTVVALFLRFLAVAPVAFALLFLVASPVTSVAFGSDSGGVAEGVRVGRPVPVVMIVFDELPTVSLLDANGDIDRRRYPNFARLAERSTWYRNTTTVAQQTEKAVPALLTGRIPPEEQVAPTAAEYERNLFTLLQRSHVLRAIEPSTSLCGSSCETSRETGAALRALLEDATEVWRQRASPKRQPREPAFFGAWARAAQGAGRDVDAFIDALDAGGERPALDFLHVMSPHTPWRHLPSGAVHNARAVPGSYYGVWQDEAAALAARQRHLLQAGYTDELLGDVLTRLEQLGTFDDSLVVVTADHGAAFVAGEHMREPAEANYHEVGWVPLLIKAPGQREGERRDDPARTVDVLPTIADHLDIEVPWRLSGESLLEPRRADDGRVRFMATQSVEAEIVDEHPTFDRERGFARVLRDAPPIAPGGSTSLLPYRFGRLGPLVGSRLDDLDTDGARRHRGSLDDERALRDVDLDAATVPNHVSGVVVSERPPTVAIGVNGIFGGWSGGTPKYPRSVVVLGDAAIDLPEGPDDAWAFEVFLPPSLLREGDNEIEVFVAEGEPESPTLSRVELG